MSLTVGEAMAIVVLKGDKVAAYVLADKLIEESVETQKSRAIREAATREHPIAFDGYEVYSWPEFQAFAKRLGLMWDLRTVNLTITINEGEAVSIKQEYRGSDIPPE